MKRHYTILMALMGLEIGGAETHVVELSKQLHKEGHRIIVASNGGVYEKELAQCGIRHYHVPMNERNPKNLIRSYGLLRQIIAQEKVDIVHSHARIPSFLCGMLHRKMKFPFVTSAHWVFYTGMGLKYLSNWGQKTVAVSEDIKQYLMDNYGVKAHDIFVTINGIDTEKFSPAVTGQAQKEELGIQEGDEVLVYVSRMDEDRALVARQLIALTPALVQQIPRLRLVIVGGGNVFDALAAQAKQINEQLGRDVILMTGARTDINGLVALGKAFVGVSRAALEAMAAQKPVIIAGNEGYIGLFGQEKLALAQENNFCCRSCPPSSPDRLLSDVVRVMRDLSDQEREALGRYGREVIIRYYSVEKMAADCEKAYDAAWKATHLPEQKVLISGYYGFENCGDDAILLSMSRNIWAMEENVRLKAMVNQPRISRKKYDMDVVNRYNIFSVLHAIGQCDVLISGGGSLLQDKTSARSILYYLSVIRYAKWCGKKVMLYANGIGPVKKAINRARVREVANRADLITLREESSLRELCDMGMTNRHAFVTADPVFTMEAASPQTAMQILQRNGVPEGKRLCVSVRGVKGNDGFLDALAAICDGAVKQMGLSVVFIPMQLPHDVVASRIVQQRMQQPSYLIEEPLRPEETMGLIGQMDLVMSMRLHTLIFSARQHVPFVGISADPKIDYYLRDLDMPSVGSMQHCDPDHALREMKHLLSHRQEKAEQLVEQAKKLEKKAHENETYLKELFGRQDG